MTIPYIGPANGKHDVPYKTFADGFSFNFAGPNQNIREVNDGSRSIAEFIGADDFGSEWYERVRFEVDAGRQRVPILYTSLYSEVIDASLPETQLIKNWGPGGFVFEELVEGEEVKFGHIQSSEAAVTQRSFGVGVEYTKKLVMFNQLWQIARIERAVGEAHNALLNHLHLNPIISYTYTSPNQTAGVTTGTSTTEDWFLTIEQAIVNSQADTTNPRMGPYALLVHPSKNFMLQRALTRVPQEGFMLDSNAGSFVNQIIGYNGWTGTRGKKQVTYPGVATTKGYLVNLAYRDEDFISLVKQALESVQGNADISRFILDQIVWDVWLAVYSNPGRAVEEITWPV